MGRLGPQFGGRDGGRVEDRRPSIVQGPKFGRESCLRDFFEVLGIGPRVETGDDCGVVRELDDGSWAVGRDDLTEAEVSVGFEAHD